MTLVNHLKITISYFCSLNCVLFPCSISPSLMREASYSAIRLGLYEPFKELFGEKNKAKTPLYKKILCAGLSGTIGSAIANPTDLVKIRMQGEGKLDLGELIHFLRMVNDTPTPRVWYSKRD